MIQRRTKKSLSKKEQKEASPLSTKRKISSWFFGWIIFSWRAFRLKQLRNQRLREVTLQLQNSLKTEKVEGELKWIETVDNALSLRKKGHFGGTLLLIFATACLILLALGVSLQIPSSRILLEVYVTNIGLEFGNKPTLTWTEFVPLTHFRVSGATSVKTGAMGEEFQQNQDILNKFDLDMRTLQMDIKPILPSKTPCSAETVSPETFSSPAIQLNEVSIEEIDNIFWKLDEKKLNWAVKGKEVKGKVSLYRAKYEIKKNGKILERDQWFSAPPETMNWSTGPVNLNSFHMLTKFQTSWCLENRIPVFPQQEPFQVQKVILTEETSPDSGLFNSAIRSGKLTFQDTGETIDLLRGDHLVLEDLDIIRYSLQGQDRNRIKLQMEGTTKIIRLTVNGLEKNLHPSWLEYLLKEKRIHAVWVALGGIWSLFLWVKWSS